MPLVTRSAAPRARAVYARSDPFHFERAALDDHGAGGIPLKGGARDERGTPCDRQRARARHICERAVQELSLAAGFHAERAK